MAVDQKSPRAAPRERIMVGMLTSKDVTRQVFTQTSMRRGYDEREVDDFLDEVIETLRYYEQGGRPGSPAPEASAHLESGGISQRASRWLRGDPE